MPAVDKVSGYYEHIIRTFRVGGRVIVALMNPDTGPVDVTVADDPAQAMRNLADSFAMTSDRNRAWRATVHHAKRKSAAQR